MFLDLREAGAEVLLLGLLLLLGVEVEEELLELDVSLVFFPRLMEGPGWGAVADV